jgi:predicted O-linked N-acetylglucosamine transferase (SPINDLY family)
MHRTEPAGEALLQQGKWVEAADSFRAGLARAPDDAHLLAGLGDALHAAGDLAGAVEAYEHAVTRDGGLARAWWGLGCALSTLKRYVAASGALRQTVRLVPDDGQARHNLGKALFEIGQTDTALNEFRHALRLLGPNELTLGQMATIVPGCHSADNRTILEVRRAWAALYPLPDPATQSFGRPRSPSEDRLRVGYVSSFFHRRNWMKPVWGVINHHDRDRFEIHLFSDAPESRIQHGYRKDLRDRFHDISGLSNQRVAELIRGQGIDVLVDLNGYSKLPRLPLFALRPAPVVVSWFSMYATSGMRCFDSLVVDEHVIPAEEEEFYSEPVVRLPGCYLVFEVGYPVPDVVPAPCLARSEFTFGCLAPQYKITTENVAAWSRILHGSPGSRLVLKNVILGSEEGRGFLLGLFSRCGIPPARLELDGPAEHYEFLEKYAAIDLALDTFPYNGGTTTAEALWQGVPVHTFLGDRWTSRISASMLRNAGLDEFIAPNLEGYVRQAVELANAPDTPARLDALRRGMRDRLRHAPVCDVRGFARSLEGEYLRLWQRWCDGQEPA